MCTFSCIWAIRLCCTACIWFLNNCKENIHCSQRGQPTNAAVGGEGRIVLHHEPNQKQLDDSTEGLRTSGRRRWLIIYEQD